MTDKFNNLINSTFASLVEVAAAVKPEEAAQNPDVALQHAAQTIAATGGPKNAKDKELLKLAQQKQNKQTQTSAETIKNAKELEQAQQDVKS